MNNNSIYKTPQGQKLLMDIYDEVLAKWPVPYDELTVPTRHGKTFIIASGDAAAPPLILLHGSTSNAVSWIGEVAEYSRYFRTLAVDILGEPGRSDQTRPLWNGKGYAEWMEDILNYLDIRESRFAGLSQGGWTALKFAVNHPERVSKLVLIAPAGVIPTKLSFLARVMWYSLYGKSKASAINRYVIGNENIDEFAVRYSNLILTHFKARMESMNMFSDEELRKLNMPVLFIGGGKDVIQNNAKIDRRLRKLLPSFESIIYPEKGHALISQAQETIPFLK